MNKGALKIMFTISKIAVQGIGNFIVYFVSKDSLSYLYTSHFITPRGIRIPVTSVKGRCPRPLDDGG